MELFHLKRDIPFMRWARTTIFFSVAAIVISIGLLATKGLNLGVDFTGGTVMEVGYPKAADLQAVRGQLAEAGHADAQVQTFGTSTDVLIRLPVKAGVTSAQLSETVLNILRQAEPKVELRRVEFVGPQVGGELFDDGAPGACGGFTGHRPVPRPALSNGALPSGRSSPRPMTSSSSWGSGRSSNGNFR